MQVFIFGAGYSGKAFAAEAQRAKATIAGTTRAGSKFEALRKAGIYPFQFDGSSLSDDVKVALTETSHLIISIAPDESGDPVLNAAGEVLIREMPKLRWIGYLSTVGVYGDYQGGWVDEGNECRPVSGRSVMRVEAEQAWQKLAESAAKPLAILRLSGIYGPGRNALVNLKQGTAKRLIKEGQVFNRIHVADIAGALWHLAETDQGGIFNVTDDESAPPQDVVTYAAELMGVEPPVEIPFETAQLSPMARSFYGENKRVSNRKLRDSGYAFRFPTYRTAFEAMWLDDNWRGEGQADKRSAMKTA